MGIASVVVILDLVTKAWVLAHLEVGRPMPIIGDLLQLSLSHNTGALFGLFRDSAPLFAVVSLAVIGLIVGYEARAGSNWLASVALGLLFGGAIGNLADRIRLGYVVDFVDFGYHSNWWPVFNVADSAIVVGVALLALNALSTPTPSEETTRAGDASG